MISKIIKLTIEGWRNISHSYALVNQFQILSLASRSDIEINHIDVPFHYPNWNQATNQAGFAESDEIKINSLISNKTILDS